MKKVKLKVLPIAIFVLVNAVAMILPTPLRAQTPSDRGIAPSSRMIRPVLIGDSLPNVSVAATNGEATSLRSICNGKPSVLIFYRGGW